MVGAAPWKALTDDVAAAEVLDEVAMVVDGFTEAAETDED